VRHEDVEAAGTQQRRAVVDAAALVGREERAGEVIRTRSRRESLAGGPAVSLPRAVEGLYMPAAARNAQNLTLAGHHLYDVYTNIGQRW
jgi:hypothetical protein